MEMVCLGLISSFNEGNAHPLRLRISSGEKSVSPFSCSHIFSEPLLKGLLRGVAYPLSVHVCTETILYMRCVAYERSPSRAGLAGRVGRNAAELRRGESHRHTSGKRAAVAGAWFTVGVGPLRPWKCFDNLLFALSISPPTRGRWNYCDTLQADVRAFTLLWQEVCAAPHYQNRK